MGTSFLRQLSSKKISLTYVFDIFERHFSHILKNNIHMLLIDNLKYGTKLHFPNHIEKIYYYQKGDDVSKSFMIGRLDNGLDRRYFFYIVDTVDIKNMELITDRHFINIVDDILPKNVIDFIEQNDFEISNDHKVRF